MAFIAGAFTGNYGAADIGQVSNGFTIEYFQNGQLIVGDNLGRTPQDIVLQGLEVFVSFELMEWNADALKTVFWPFNATYGTGPTIGALGTTIDNSLVLTAVASTGSASLTAEDVYTFPRCLLAEGFPVNILFGPVLRAVPIRLRVYPSTSNVFFTVA